MDFPTSPFGSTITCDDIIASMQACDGWEARYRQVILWGKQLPVMPESLKSEQVMVAGCESQVWLVAKEHSSLWQCCADSDARIVRGLIAIVMAALNNQSTDFIQQFNVEGYFDALGLMDHLSPSRGNGLKAIVERIQTLAHSA